jgi:hypothetical protein
MIEIAKSIEIIKSLADTSRLRVLKCLMDKSQYVEEIAQRMNLAVSTVSFHLKKLEKAGLINKVKEQYYFVYHINEDVFNLTLRELTDFENFEKFIQDERIEKYRQKVLKTFIKENRLTKLPVQRKKRMIIIDEFTKMFQPHRSYSEEEINSIILKSYDDYCTIRRLMIEEGIMKRENQIYWLNKD